MKRFLVLGIVVAVVVLGWTAGWFYVSGEIRNTVAALAQNEDPAQPTLACGGLSITGFPFRFDIACTGATVTSGDLVARTEELRVSALVYRPTHLQAFARSPLTLDDAFTGARSQVDWTGLEASLRLEDWRIARTSVVARDVAWTDTLAGGLPIAGATAIAAHLVDVPAQYDTAAGTATLAAYADIDGLTSPGLAIAAGDGIVEAQITRVPADVRSWGEGDLLRRWQANGGAIVLSEARGSDEPDFVTANGEVKLDDSGRPEGQIALSSRGLAERLSMVIPEGMRPLILGQQAPDGTYSQTITMQSGVVMSGVMPTALLTPLW